MVDDKKTLKFQMMMSPNEAEELDDWMFKNRVRSRAEAIRRLCRMGLVWDAYGDEINEAMKATTEAYGKGVKKVTAALGEPSENNPPWVSDYVRATGEALHDVGAGLSMAGEALRAVGTPAGIMKLEGEFEDVHAESLRWEAEILEEKLEAYGVKLSDRKSD